MVLVEHEGPGLRLRSMSGRRANELVLPGRLSPWRASSQSLDSFGANLDDFVSLLGVAADEVVSRISHRRDAYLGVWFPALPSNLAPHPIRRGLTRR